MTNPEQLKQLIERVEGLATNTYGTMVLLTIEQRDALCTALRELLDERDSLREQVAEAKRWQFDVEEREAAVCPEDIGFDEHIRYLQTQLAQVRDGVWERAIAIVKDFRATYLKDGNASNRILGYAAASSVMITALEAAQKAATNNLQSRG